MITNAEWIGLQEDFGTVCPQFKKDFGLERQIKSAILRITATGVYEAHINGKRVGDFVLAPGLTSYRTRLQYQEYEITDMLSCENKLTVLVGTGWYRGRISAKSPDINNTPCGLIAEIEIVYTDGSTEHIVTDNSWQVAKSNILFSDIYDGEIYDASRIQEEYMEVKCLDLPKNTLIKHEGEYILEQEKIDVKEYIITPKGEHVLDFGQNFAGYPEIKINAKRGERIHISVAEILDHDGNFYNDNYRSAKAELEYICCEGEQIFKPHFTFYGFRYIRLDEYPKDINPDNFKGIVIYSDIERTGSIKSSNRKLNKFFENVLWSQRGNFIDIPTDCPQRDERMGWTGDAQVFCRTAAYNYNVKKFFEKWLADVRAEQKAADGAVPKIVPNFWQKAGASTAWGDAICIIPWELYRIYGDKKILADNFAAMKLWVEYIAKDSEDEYLWTSTPENLIEKHYGDWLGLDAPYGSYMGKTSVQFIASAFYAYSVELLIKSGKVLGENVDSYEELYNNIVTTFKKRFNKLNTQTEHVLALVFNLCDNKKAAADSLAKLIEDNDTALQTGFVGTPYLLYALSENGYTDIAYKLLLREEYPSWLYEVNHGATTIWEHWDGITSDGKLWCTDMNSYNHYAYGSVIDWVYSVAAGIKPDNDCAGFKRAVIAPTPHSSLEWLDVALKTEHGTIRSAWFIDDDGVRYEIETPVEADIVIDGKIRVVDKGRYVFWGMDK